MATVAEIVTNTIIEKMEEGNIPWFKPWQGGEAINFVTRKPYRGVNRLLLDGGEYLTFKQIQERGGKIKKGAKSKIVIFYTPYEVNEEDTEESKTVSVLRYYRVFSIADVEGIESKLEFVERPNYEIERCQSVLDNYVSRSGVKLTTKVSNRAYYSPSNDEIVLPVKEQFKSSQHYYSTGFHESVHSTGHKDRLNRLTGKEYFGNHEYSREELTAEIGSAILCTMTGIDASDIVENSAGYIQSWLKALRNDKNMILVASAKAEKAVEYIIGERGEAT